MSAEGAQLQPSPSASSSTHGGFAGVLSKARRSRDRRSKTESRISMKSSDSDLRVNTTSADGPRDRASTEGSPAPPHLEDSESSGLSRLLTKSMAAKRRRRREKEAGEDPARGRSMTADADHAGLDETASAHGDGTGSSMMTLESEDDLITATPPPLSTHPSHSGYLTTSSPLIKASIVPSESASSVHHLDGSSSTNSLVSPALATTDASPITSTPSLQAPFAGSRRRSPSPVGRLKEALKPKQNSASPSTSPERKPGGGGTTASTTHQTSGTRSRGNSLRLGALFHDKQSAPPLPEHPLTAKPTLPDVRPSTPPQLDPVPAPVIVNTPPTPTDAQAPRFSSSRERGQSDPISSVSNPNIVTSPSGNMISHRRIRSGSASLGPSKLSQISNAPLTPTTPGAPGSNPQNSFFSSVFSAAQNAANTLSNTITNSTLTQGSVKVRQSVPTVAEDGDVEVEGGSEKMSTGEQGDDRELAVKTIGTGELSLSQFGLEISTGPNTSMAARSKEGDGKDEATAGEDTSKQAAPIVVQPGDSSDNVSSAPDKKATLVENGTAGDQTPPNGSVFEGKGGVHRSGSIRSAIGSRRKRGSSAATTSAIGAALAAANAAVANPAAQASTPKLTGFAVASKKRNRDFHQLFRSVPEDDYLIEDYSCALQREILAHGRLYVSEGHLCFSSNIFGWVTTLVMSFDEIVSVEKRSTALVFKNGLVISTLHAKNVFASFTSRDSTYDLIVGIWKLSHPSLRSSLNGVTLGEAGGGDKTEKYDPPASVTEESVSVSDSDDEEVYDEDEDEDNSIDGTQQVDGTVTEVVQPTKTVSRQPSGAMLSNSTTEDQGKDTGGAVAQDFPGPATHGPTNCTDSDTHYERLIFDEVIAAPLGKVYDLIFGPTSVTWMAKWLTGEQRCTELQMEDKKGLTNDNKVRTYSYIKPLNGSIGPKQTKCIITETLDALNLEKAVSVTSGTQTPDVPSGNVFTTKTKYCLSWAEGNGTRVQMNCTIEWTGKSWLKGPIEKGANDGQVQYAKDLAASLRSAVSKARAGAGPAGKGKKKGGRKDRLAKAETEKADIQVTVKKAVKHDWGLLEPLHGTLGPIVDIFQPLVSGNMLYGLLIGFLIASWFSIPGRNAQVKTGLSFSAPERLAAYEEIWRREESELWSWLDERVHRHGLDGIGPRQHVSDSKIIKDRLHDQQMKERELEVAIQVTEEKLQVLKAAVSKKAAPVSASSRDNAASQEVPTDL